MKFTDIFIRRPVLACVVSLVIVLLGLRAYGSLSLREYPEITYPVIKITTPYPGANADLIQGFITRPLERAIASAEGLDYVEVLSADGVSRISAHLRPGYDIDAAFVDITAKGGTAASRVAASRRGHDRRQGYGDGWRRADVPRVQQQCNPRWSR